MDLPQLRALVAAVETGTLDAAAGVLHVTPSAVSQRIRALEAATGQVLLVRSRPVVPTEAGAAVLRLARQVELLVADTTAALAGAGSVGPPVLPLAVNADSLATWFLPAVAPLAADVQVHVQVADQTLTTALLRGGTVMAAVTADPDPVPGCSVARLGTMTYRPMAARAFADRWFGDGATPAALGRAPVVVFDRTDDLQGSYLRRRVPGDPPRPPVHLVPASADFLLAVRLGMGWGMVPDLQTGPDDGLVELDPDGATRVELWWQQWKLRSPSLDQLAGAVRSAAAAALR